MPALTPSGAVLFALEETVSAPWSYGPPADGITASTAAVAVKAAAGAGVKNRISHLSVSTTTLGNATELLVRDGSAGATLFRMVLPTTAQVTPIQVDFNPPLAGSAATAIHVLTVTSATGNVHVNLQGYESL